MTDLNIYLPGEDLNLLLDTNFSKFTDLIDTPSSYNDKSQFFVRVNETENALEFAEIDTTTNWEDIEGDQSSVNLSGFTDDMNIGTHILDKTNPHETTLSNLNNPTENKTFSMGGNTVTWNFTNPVGGMLFNMTGGWSGHVFEVMDTRVTGGALGDHLMHLETSRENVLPLHAVNNHANGRAFKAEGRSEFVGDVNIDGNITANNLNLFLTENVTSTLNVGSIEAGQLLEQGTTFTEFVKELLITTFFPTFVAPSGVLSANISANVESGTTQDVTLTKTFNRGSILGDLDDGVWNPSKVQDFRSGEVDFYVIDGTNTGQDNFKILSNYQVVDGANTWSATSNYLIGIQPKDSDGNDYLEPLPSGSLTSNRTINGRRRAFFGYSNPALTSNDIRALQSSVLNPSNGTQFTINIPQGATNVVIAYPSTLRNLNSVLYVEGLNAEIKDVFTQTIISVEGANAYNPINYKVYVYEPVEPFTESATYNITI